MSQIDTRKTFRILDRAEIYYAVIEEHNKQDANSHHHLNLVKVMTNPIKYLRSLEGLIPETLTALRGVEQQIPEMLGFCKLIEKKMGILTAAFNFLIGDSHPEHPTQLVSLSYDGLSFTTQEEIKLETFLNVIVVLRPSYKDLRIVGKVKYCMPNDESQKTFKTGIEFTEISASDTQVLARHLIQLQIKAKHMPTPEG